MLNLYRGLIKNQKGLTLCIALEILKISKENGIDIAKFPARKRKEIDSQVRSEPTVLGDLKLPEDMLSEIKQKYNIDEKYPIGDSFRTIIGICKNYDCKEAKSERLSEEQIKLACKLLRHTGAIL